MPTLKWFFGDGLHELVQHALHHRRREFLRRQSIPPANHRGHRERQRCRMLGKDGHNVLIERLAGCTRFLAAVQHRNLLYRFGERRNQRLGVERPIQANLHQAHLLALARKRVHGLFGSLGARAHHHNHALGVGRAVVVKQVIRAAGQRRKPVHHHLHNARHRSMERRAGLARLEENVGILRRAAQHRLIRATCGSSGTR